MPDETSKAIEATGPAKLVIGDRVFPLSPLTLGALRHERLVGVFEVVSKLKGMPTDDQFDGVIRIVRASAKLADKTVTNEDFEAAIDALGFMDAIALILAAFKDVMTMSKFSPATTGSLKLGEADSPLSST
jgi:hypothetical protein